MNKYIYDKFHIGYMKGQLRQALFALALAYFLAYSGEHNAYASSLTVCGVPSYEGICCTDYLYEYLWPSGNGICCAGMPYPGYTFCPWVIGTTTSITITSPKNTTYTETNLLNLNVSCHDSGSGCNQSSWRFSINNGLNYTFLPNTTLTSKIGSNKLIVWIKNNAGIWNSSTVYYNIDTQKWEDDFTEGEGISASENITIADGTIRPKKIKNMAWWNDSWTGAKQINISNTAGDLTNYQLRIIHNFSQEYSAGYVQQYCSDTRFTLENGTELQYWTETCNLSHSDNATFWLKIPFLKSGAITSVYMYYSNPAANSAGNGTATFDFFDDFETWTGWNNYGSGAVAQNSEQSYTGTYSLKKSANNDPNGGYKLINSQVTLDHILEGWIYRPTPIIGGPLDRIAVEDSSYNGYGFRADHSLSMAAIQRRDAGSPTDIGAAVLWDPPENNWYRFKFIMKSGGIFDVYYYDTNNLLLSSVTGRADANYNTFDRVVVHGGHIYYLDDIRIRKYAFPEPTITITGMESVKSAEVASLQITPLNLIVWDKFCANNTTSFIYPADNLIIDGTTMILNGTHEYNIIKIINGGVLYVKDYDGDLSTGKLELRAKEIFIDATSSINANRRGYRRGSGKAIAGEGPGGGGGGTLTWGSGGGGGGYGGTGGDGGMLGDSHRGRGGSSYGNQDNAGLWMGSGGGTGSASSSTGGDGGGAIIINAEKIIIEGSVTADGSNGANIRGGGGSGGGINITTNNLTLSGSITANGGSGSRGPWAGGGGGGGRITITTYINSISGSIAANGGSGGSAPFPGASGSSGTVVINNNVDYTLPQDASITYNILRASDDAILCSGLTGNNDSISLCAGSTPSIKLYAQLIASTATPILYNWNVTWLASGPPANGTINGTVTDDSGTPQANVNIIASDGTNTYENTTNALGEYTANNVIPSAYTLTASKSGFVPDTTAGIAVNPSATSAVNFILGLVPLATISRDAVVYFKTEKDPIVMNIGNKLRMPVIIKNPSNDYALVSLHIGSPDTTFKDFIHFENHGIYPRDINITMKPNQEKVIFAEILAGKIGTHELVIGPDNIYENRYDTKRITAINKNAGIFAQTPGLGWHGIILVLAIAAALLLARNKTKKKQKK